MRRAAKISAWLAALALVAGAALLGDAEHRRPAALALDDSRAAIVISRPAQGREIRPGDSIQEAVDSAPAGAVLCLAPGIYRGPLSIHRPLTLWGPPGAIIRSDGRGRTVSAEADGVELLGFTVDGSGRRYDKMDSAVYLRGAGVKVRGLVIRNALYGIVVERSSGVVLEGNHVIGDKNTPLGLRGDAFRIWGTRDSMVTGNSIEDSRDLLVWFSPNVRISENVVRRSRYATHFMYANGSAVEHNRFIGNIVGVFVMYSDNIAIAHNLIAANMSSDGYGVGAKESGNLDLDGNRFIQDRVGVYLDYCPFHTGQTDRLRGNLFALCETAIASLGSRFNNSFEDNTLRDNQMQVRAEERGDLMNTRWARNYFDDYQGYDLDGDGFGDIPYELRSLSGELIGEYPDLSFFRGTAALSVIEAVSSFMPLFQPSPLLVDHRPRMQPLPGSGSGAAGQ